MTSVLALDLSLTGTGVCFNGSVSTIKTNAKQADVERLHHISSEIVSMDCDIVFMEGLAFAANTGKSTERAGLAWLVRVGFWLKKTPYVVVPPTVLKKWVTGSGAATKDEMLIETIKKAPADIIIKNNNESDAYGLWTLGKEMVGEPIWLSVPAKNRQALEKIELPGMNLVASAKVNITA